MGLVFDNWIGRILCAVVMVTIVFIPLPEEYYRGITAIEAIFAWIAIYYLTKKLNLKNKTAWRICALLFSVITYIVFLVRKRKELSAL